MMAKTEKVYLTECDEIKGERSIRGAMWSDVLDVEQMSEAERSAYGLVNHLRALGRFGYQYGPDDIRPLPRKDRKQFVNAYLNYIHQHNGAVTGWTDVLTIRDQVSVFGLLVMSYPVARKNDDGLTLEVTRLALMTDVPKNAASKLLGRAAVIAKAKGYERLISYSLENQGGTCYAAAGWTMDDHIVVSRQWSPKRRRQKVLDSDSALLMQNKRRWSKNLTQKKRDDDNIRQIEASN
tara:strand:- start:822 stop:1532 length:711 start_codon:yes stop_codon:yes gene_type:complete